MQTLVTFLIIISVIFTFNWLRANTISKVKFYGRITSLINIILIIILPAAIELPISLYAVLVVTLLTVAVLSSLGRKFA